MVNQRSDSTQDLPARSIAAAIDRTNARKINNLEILCQEKRELVLRVICPPFAAIVINFVRSQKLGDSPKVAESPLQLFLFTEKIL